MNKILTKRMLSANNVPTAKFVTITKECFVDWQKSEEKLIQEIGLPMVVKAPSQGSSIGVSIVKDKESLRAVLEETFAYEEEILVETFIDGTELTLSILGNTNLYVLPEVEIVSNNEFYDYQAKYTKGESQHIIPARINEDIREKVQDLGKKTYRCVGCRGLSRIDFIVDKAGQPWVIEINTLPGMTETSLFPDAARSAGISFEELVEKIAILGWEASRA